MKDKLKTLINILKRIEKKSFMVLFQDHNYNNYISLFELSKIIADNTDPNLEKMTH